MPRALMLRRCLFFHLLLADDYSLTPAQLIQLRRAFISSTPPLSPLLAAA